VLEQAKGRIGILQTEAGTTAQTFVNFGNPAKVVADAAKDFNADLLVMGRHSARALPDIYARTPAPSCTIRRVQSSVYRRRSLCS
jgi:nucleotide-binding universal stress UspA family protein